MTIAELAKEMGIDVAALKPEFIERADRMLLDADGKLTNAQQLQKTAEDNLRRVQEEQSKINEYIEKYGESEQTNAALRANYAAMEASLKELKAQGFNVNLPDPVKLSEPKSDSKTLNVEEIYQNVGTWNVRVMDANNRYMALTGKPLPESLEDLARQAGRTPVYQFIADKYKFAELESAQRAKAEKEHDEQIAAAAVKKYQEEHPAVQGNPDLRAGIVSRNPAILKPRDPKELKDFAGLPARDKIAQSVARTREAIAANQQ